MFHGLIALLARRAPLHCENDRPGKPWFPCSVATPALGGVRCGTNDAGKGNPSTTGQPGQG
jgi:hypothetical protein